MRIEHRCFTSSFRRAIVRAATVWFLSCICSFGLIAQTTPKTNAVENDAQATRQDSALLAAQVTPGSYDRMVINTSANVERVSDNSCAYMRTYRVKRQAQNSDAVTPSGYTTCTPMRRFETKSAGNGK